MSMCYIYISQCSRKNKNKKFTQPATATTNYYYYKNIGILQKTYLALPHRDFQTVATSLWLELSSKLNFIVPKDTSTPE